MKLSAFSLKCNRFVVRDLSSNIDDMIYGILDEHRAIFPIAWIDIHRIPSSMQKRQKMIFVGNS